MSQTQILTILLAICIGLLTLASLFSITSVVTLIKQYSSIFQQSQELISQSKLLTNLVSKNNDKIEKIVQRTTNLIDIMPGDKVLYPKFPLIWSEAKEEFTVNFECDVVDATEIQVKVKAYAASTDNIRWNKLTPPEQQNTLRHLNGKWVDKSKVQVILDEKQIRDIKLDKLLED